MNSNTLKFGSSGSHLVELAQSTIHLSYNTFAYDMMTEPDNIKQDLRIMTAVTLMPPMPVFRPRPAKLSCLANAMANRCRRMRRVVSATVRPPMQPR